MDGRLIQIEPRNQWSADAWHVGFDADTETAEMVSPGLDRPKLRDSLLMIWLNFAVPAGTC
jgi:hypothetical protein